MAQVTGDDAQPEPALHPLLPVIRTFAPAIIASQAGNSALDARTPAIAPPPPACLLLSLAFLGDLALRWDCHQLNPCCLQQARRLGRMHSSIACHQMRGMAQDLLVMRYRLDRLPMLMRMLQDLIASHHPSLHFVQHHLSTELDQCSSFVARN